MSKPRPIYDHLSLSEQVEAVCAEYVAQLDPLPWPPVDSMPVFKRDAQGLITVARFSTTPVAQPAPTPQGLGTVRQGDHRLGDFSGALS